MFDVVIRNGLIVDGSGKDAYKADLAISGDKVVKIAEKIEESGKYEYDAAGKYVTPGFIDPHTHTDLSVLFEPSSMNYLEQGVTTTVGGNCGHSYGPVGDEMYRSAIIDTKVVYKAAPSYFQMNQLLLPKEPAAKALKEVTGIDMDWHSFGEYLDKCNQQPLDGNICPLAGYSAIRGTVMGLDCLREATPEELDRIEVLTRQCMEDGAYGLSTGTDPQYVPGPYATHDETVRMLKVVKEYDGIYTSHTFNFDLKTGVNDKMAGYRQMLDIAKDADIRCNISHVHTMGMGIDEESNAKAAKDSLKLFEEYAAQGVDISYDVIPSPYSMDMTVPYFSTFLRPFVLMCGSRKHLAESFRVPDFRQMVHTVVDAGMYPNLSTKEIMMSIYPVLTVSRHVNSEYLGKSLYQLASEKGVDPLDFTMDIFAEDPDMNCDMALPSCVESNHIICRHPMAMMCSDGFTGGKDMNFGVNEDIMMTPNPMNFSYTIRYLTNDAPARFEDAINVLTKKVSDRFAIKGRGYLEEGCFADVLVIDKEKLHSHDRDVNIFEYPEGIDQVYVNGVLTIDHKVHTGAHSGRMLRKNIND